MIKFSVIIPTYNCAQYVTQALDSVLAQTYPHFEVIIVDDGSTDNTRNVILPYLEDKRVKYVYRENGGLAVARNTGIKEAQGDYIALLDADDLWKEDKLEMQAEFIKQHPNVAMICGNAYKFEEDNRQKLEVIHQNLPEGELTSAQLFSMLLVAANPVICPTVVMGRWIFAEIGMYDENLSRLGCEDRDLSLRVMSKYDVRYMKECLAYYRLRVNSMHGNVEKMHRARMYVLEKSVKTLPRLKTNAILRQRSFANVYYYNALGFFRNGSRKEVLKNLGKAFSYFPFDKRFFVLLAKSLLS